MTESFWFYPIFVGQTRDDVLAVLGPDAFSMTGMQIVDELIAQGYAPDVLDPSHEP